MSRVAHVWPHAPRVVDGEQEVAADVEWPATWPRFWKDRRQRVDVRLPTDVPVPDAAIGDAFLLAAAFTAMRRCRVLRVHASVAEGLAGNIERLSELWASRRPDKYRPIEVRADGTIPAVPATGPSLLCYSGGIDSTYALLVATASGAAPPPLGAALMLRGADIPVEETAAYDRAFERSRRIVESRGVPLLSASMTLRRLHQNWTHSGTAAFAAVLTLFRGRYGRGLLASGLTTTEAMMLWPKEVTDPPLVSSKAFQTVGVGYDADRFEKMAGLAAWPEALEHLRVCYAPGVWDRNCGLCFKCVTVMFFARIACGRMPPFMPRDVTDEDAIAIARAKDFVMPLRLALIVRHARERGVDASWVRLIEHELSVARSLDGPGGR